MFYKLTCPLAFRFELHHNPDDVEHVLKNYRYILTIPPHSLGEIDIQEVAVTSQDCSLIEYRRGRRQRPNQTRQRKSFASFKWPLLQTPRVNPSGLSLRAQEVFSSLDSANASRDQKASTYLSSLKKLKRCALPNGLSSSASPAGSLSPCASKRPANTTISDRQRYNSTRV